MPARKESCTDARIEEELQEERPIYLVLMAAMLKLLFFIYDAIVYIPFKLLADPDEKVKVSNRVKAVRVAEAEDYAIWRHVDTAGGELWANSFRGCDTLGQVWDQAVKCHVNLPCMGTREVLELHIEEQPNGRKFQKLALGAYKWMDYLEVDAKITALCNALDKMGLRKGEHVTIYAETRAEWMITANACFKKGLPVITIYPTLGKEGIKQALEESDSVAIFTTLPLMKSLLKAVEEAPELKHVIYYSELHCDPNDVDACTLIDEDTRRGFEDVGRTTYKFEQLLEEWGAPPEMSSHYSEEEEVKTAKPSVRPEDLAMIMYTSGTTGKPKGVMLSHRNIVTAIASQSAVINVGREDTSIGYLPLAHIIEVCVELVCLAKGCRIGYSSAQTLIDKAPKIQEGTKGDCTELKPTLIVCVPAIMDRIFKAISERVKEKSTVQREFFRIAYERKRARQERGYVSKILNGLVFHETRKALGGKVRTLLSGGAALNEETQRFMNICFCCPAMQGYGLTETCGGATIADVLDLSTGTVGPPLRCCEIMLREWKDGGYSPHDKIPQGEILIHGAHVSPGYYKNEEQTREAFFDIDGKRWFATGDVGEFLDNGSLRIIDRKKDLVKLAHGEYISLGRVEHTLRRSEFIDNICVVASIKHNFVVALIVPNRKHLHRLAEEIGVSTEAAKWEELCRDVNVRNALQERLQDFSKDKLKRYEIPRRVFICADVWDSDTEKRAGLLTETKKLKRRAIELEYQKEVGEMFAALI